MKPARVTQSVEQLTPTALLRNDVLVWMASSKIQKLVVVFPKQRLYVGTVQNL